MQAFVQPDVAPAVQGYVIPEPLVGQLMDHDEVGIRGLPGPVKPEDRGVDGSRLRLERKPERPLRIDDATDGVERVGAAEPAAEQ